MIGGCVRAELRETLRTDGGARLGREVDLSTGLGGSDFVNRVRCGWADADAAVTEAEEGVLPVRLAPDVVEQKPEPSDVVAVRTGDKSGFRSLGVVDVLELRRAGDEAPFVAAPSPAPAALASAAASAASEVVSISAVSSCKNSTITE